MWDIRPIDPGGVFEDFQRGFDELRDSILRMFGVPPELVRRREAPKETPRPPDSSSPRAEEAQPVGAEAAGHQEAATGRRWVMDFMTEKHINSLRGRVEKLEKKVDGDVEVLHSMVQDLHEDRPEQKTLLDEIAIDAMRMLLPNVIEIRQRQDELGRDEPDKMLDAIAVVSYGLAEKMLIERAKRMKK